MEKAEEATSKSKAKGKATFLFDVEGGVVELEFNEGVADVFELGGVDGVDAGVDDRFDEFKAGKGRGGAAAEGGNRVADFDIGGFFDVCDDVSDFAGAEDVDLLFVRRKDADFKNFKAFIGCHHFDLCPFFDLAADNAGVDHHAAVRVVVRVKNKGAQKIVFGRFRGRGVGDDFF